MKRFLWRLAAFGAIQLVIVGWVLSYGAPRNGNHYLAAVHDKRVLLGDGNPQPRLIFVGGSNVAFGIRSRDIAQPLKLRPVNAGLHAGLGIELPLRLVERSVREGDLVVVIPEYSLMVSDAFAGDAKILAQLMEQWPGASEMLAPNQVSGVRRFLERDGLWLAHLWVRRARYHYFDRHPRNGIYTRDGFNADGDMVGHYDSPSSPLEHAGALPPIEQEWLAKAIARFNAFERHCRTRGASVVFSYPPLPTPVFESSRAELEQIDRQLRAELKMPILHSPAELAFPDSQFYDSIYHLTRAGAASRSQRLLARLSPLADSLPQTAARPKPRL